MAKDNTPAETRRDRRDENATANDPVSDGEKLGQRRDVIPADETGAGKARREAGVDGTPAGSDAVTDARMRGAASAAQTKPHDAGEARGNERQEADMSGVTDETNDANAEALDTAKVEAADDKDALDATAGEPANADDSPPVSGAAGEDDQPSTPEPARGKLPDDFPGKTALEAAGITTYAKVRKLADADELTTVEGVGKATADKIKEALGTE